LKLREQLKRWWEGRYIPPDNPPESMVVFTRGRYERHWSSQAAHIICDFYFQHWKWLWPMIVALIVGILKFL
jgi:hypothetical protein